MQEYTSANTSINSSKLPAIYNKLNWEKLRKDYPSITSTVLDYGAGKYTNHIRDFCNNRGFLYSPYDPYNQPDIVNAITLSKKPSIIICSNVLNVINSKEEIIKIHDFLIKFDKPYFITVYEGDKSCIGKKTKEDCWQRNEPLSNYKARVCEHIKKNILTSRQYLEYIK